MVHHRFSGLEDGVLELSSNSFELLTLCSFIINYNFFCYSANMEEACTQLHILGSSSCLEDRIWVTTGFKCLGGCYMAGSQGMQWSDLLHSLLREFGCPPPHALLIHLGNTDLGLLTGKALVIQARDNFKFILEKWPGVLILWSAMVPWHTWRATLDVGQADRVRYNINREIRNALVSGLGQYTMHPEIQADELRLNHSDGVISMIRVRISFCLICSKH